MKKTLIALSCLMLTAACTERRDYTYQYPGTPVAHWRDETIIRNEYRDRDWNNHDWRDRDRRDRDDHDWHDRDHDRDHDDNGRWH